ncbi:PAS domain S-box-containing protein [Maribacter aquivivus]|uniref:histidine kinase n=1 Tax=Maribacter aquivivus TaxID=228958 RepID=A0A1M6L820_9FLAO|nr:PAS domain S-box protein [Maribacter aquivivus]SHJ67330.1 PAS domain S-box-containing protein [Maribacter aquivivus]
MEKHHQIFIEQTPTAIAMLDTNMVYLAASKQWVQDFKLEKETIIGRSHYDIFPEIGDDWKAKHQQCLQGAIDICDEAPFYRKDGSIQWIYWDVRPWYNAEGEIGGLLMHTGDITEQKEKELKEKKFNTILRDTSEIARIGTWEIDLVQEKVIWSSMVYEIHEVPLDYEPTIASGLDFFEDEESRNRVLKSLKEAQEIGTPVNLNLNLKTAKGNYRWVKVIGKVEQINGESTKIYGITQDITSSKNSEQLLNVAYAELEAIFNSNSMAVITTDKDGVINRFNSGAEKLLGYSAKEMIGINKPEIYLFEEELNVFKKDMELEFKGDSSDANFNYRNEKIYNTRQWTFKRKDETTFSGLKSLTAIQNKDGFNDGFIAVITDISKIKEVKDELRKKNELLNFAEQITMMGNWKWNVITNEVKWSTNLYSIFDFDSEQSDLNYDTYFNFVHPDDKEMVSKHVETAIEFKKFENLLHRIMLKDGTVKTIKLMSEIFTNHKGEVVELFGTCQDVTESKKEEQKLIKAKEALEIVAQKLSYQNKQLADFTHITSHNLRAPVANLNSLMEIYKLSDDDKERLDIFSKFDTVIDRLTLTLNTLIEALKTKISDAQEELESVDLNDIFEDTTQILSGSILTSGAVIKGDFTELSTITYNRIYMDSIFLNLIGNAIKYRAKDRVPEIIVKSKIKNGRNIITFKDNGLGIDLERHGHKLFGLNKVFHRHPDAKGVGLFLTKTQVEAMGGTITATSEVNVGTTFTIIF